MMILVYMQSLLAFFKYEGKHTAEALFDSCEGDEGLMNQWNQGKFKRVYSTDSFSANAKAFKKCEIRTCSSG